MFLKCFVKANTFMQVKFHFKKTIFNMTLYDLSYSWSVFTLVSHYSYCAHDIWSIILSSIQQITQMWKKWFEKTLKLTDTVAKKDSLLEIMWFCSFQILIHGTICLKGCHRRGIKVRGIWFSSTFSLLLFHKGFYVQNFPPLFQIHGLVYNIMEVLVQFNTLISTF